MKFNLNTPITDEKIIERLNNFLEKTSFKLRGIEEVETYSVIFNKVFTNKENILCIKLKIKDYMKPSYIILLFKSFIKGIINGGSVPASILGFKDEVVIELMNKNKNKINYIIKALEDKNITSYEKLIDKAEELSISKIITYVDTNVKESIFSENILEWLNDNISSVRVMLGRNSNGKDNLTIIERSLQNDFPDLDLDDPNQVTYYNNLSTEQGKAIKAIQMYITIPSKNLQDAPEVIKSKVKNGMIVDTNLVWEICKRAQKLDLYNLYPGFKINKNN